MYEINKKMAIDESVIIPDENVSTLSTSNKRGRPRIHTVGTVVKYRKTEAALERQRLRNRAVYRTLQKEILLSSEENFVIQRMAIAFCECCKSEYEDTLAAKRKHLSSKRHRLHALVGLSTCTPASPPSLTTDLPPSEDSLRD